MNDDPRVLEFVQEALESGSTPEVACRALPELLGSVREHFARLRSLDHELAALFPTPSQAGRPLPLSADAPGALPRVPGHELLGALGRGGMGVVYRARHLGLPRDVALEMLLEGEYAGPRDLQRSLLEARAVAKRSHTNIVALHDVGAAQGRAYFTLELLGEAPRARSARRARRSPWTRSSSSCSCSDAPSSSRTRPGSCAAT